MSTTTLPSTLTGSYAIDPTHSRVGFVARHAMVTKVRGSFNEFAGTGYQVQLLDMYHRVFDRVDAVVVSRCGTSQTSPPAWAAPGPRRVQRAQELRVRDAVQRSQRGHLDRTLSPAGTRRRCSSRRPAFPENGRRELDGPHGFGSRPGRQ